MNKNRKKNFIKFGYMALFFAVIAVSISVLATQTLGWLNARETALSDVVVSDFQVTGQASFGSGGSGGGTGGGATVDLKGISISNPNDSKYLGKMKYAVKYEGISPAYVRVRILEQWVDKKTDTILDVPFTDYTVGGDWYDNRINDNCYYYKGLVGTQMITSAAIAAMSPSPSAVITISAITKTIPLIDGVKMENIKATDETTEFTLIIEVQAVQPNRYREFWNMQHLPWETVTVKP